ncbi:MAG: right-handed parallel beta-helix repeat-containing protein, partial [Planctomycetota bacterium]
MNSDRAYILEFKPRRTIHVTGGGPALKDTVEDEGTGNGDIIYVEKGYTYDGDIDLQGKEIAIVSSEAADPTLTAEIDCQGSGRAFTFDNGEGPSALIQGFTIINGNTGTQSGGAIYIGPGSSPTLANLIIRDCNVGNARGGAIFIGSDSEPNLCYITITNCSTAFSGGAIYVAANSSPLLKHCTITNCSASLGSGGGVYCGANCSAEFISCTFSNNHARYSGGGLYFSFDNNPTLTQCTFSNNAADSGAGIYFRNDCVSELTDCTFTGNTVNEKGGGIVYDTGNLITVVDCDFTDNSADSGGGLYCEPNCFGDIYGSTLVDNDANDDGGAIYIGGTMYMSDSNITIADCNISNNSAAHGAGVYFLWSPESSIVGCTINNNDAFGLNVWYEYFYPDPNDPNLPDPNNPVDQTDPNFDPNDPNIFEIRHEDTMGPAQGAGIYAFAGPKLIKDCQISYNAAATSGGGLYLAGDDDFELEASTELNNCLITNNRAGRYGGGVSCYWFIEAKIFNCTIADNRATQVPSYGGGLYCSYESNVEVIDSIIWNNVSPYRGSQVAVGSGAPCQWWPSTVTITHSDIGPPYDPNAIMLLDTINPDALPVIRPGFDSNSLYANDDRSTGLVDIGFEINFFGLMYDQLYVNNNGNVTFDANMWEFTPWGLTTNIGRRIIAPYFADVDTRPDDANTGAGALTRYGTGTVNGHNAFGVTWIDVGYYYVHWDKLNSFQMILIDRSDRAPGDFDIEFNYEEIEWETGDASLGQDGFGGDSARAGFSNGTGELGTFYEFEYSGVHGAFLDSNSTTGLIYNNRNSSIPGRYIFTVEGGTPGILSAISSPVHVEDNCTLNGDIIFDWDPNSYSWSPDSYNIDADPCFIAGYYLSHTATGQEANSPCVDTGSDLASNVGMDMYTTRIDGVNDVSDSNVDMGYHYWDGLLRYDLTVTVIDANGDPVDPNHIHGYVEVEPNNSWFFEGEVVVLTAHPDTNGGMCGYRVKKWTDTDDDESTAPYNTVTMTKDRDVTVEFELIPVRELTVTVQEDPNDPGIYGSFTVDSNATQYHYFDANYCEGATLTLTAHPNSGRYIEGWYDEDANLLSPRRTLQLAMDSDENIHLRFRETQLLTVGPGLGYPTIQEGLDAALPGDTVRVFGGSGTYIYSPPSSDGIDFHGKSITLEGDLPTGPVIIDCVKNGRAFNFHSGEDAEAVVSGLTIKNGYVHGPVGFGGYDASTLIIDPNDPNADPNGGPGGDAYGNARGGGILCTNGSSPTFIDCTITNCMVAGAVGGIGGYGLYGEIVGIGGIGGDGIGTGYGGAVACTDNSNPTFINCTITGNRAVGGIAGLGGYGGLYYYGYPGRGIGDGVGGGVYAAESNPRFVDCTISDNVASNSDDIIQTYDSDFFNDHIYWIDYYYLSGYYYSYWGWWEAYYYLIGGTGYGAGVCFGEDVTAEFTNCDFTNNRIRGRKWEWSWDFWDPRSWDPNVYDPGLWDFYSPYYYPYYERPYPTAVYYGDGAGLCSAANNTLILKDCTFTGNRIGNEEQR